MVVGEEVEGLRGENVYVCVHLPDKRMWESDLDGISLSGLFESNRAWLIMYVSPDCGVKY